MNNQYTKDFVSFFFGALEKQKIPYCILRGYEALPEETGRDVDIFIQDRKDIRTVIEDLIRQAGWSFYKRNDSDGFFTYICDRIEENDVSVMQLDFWTSLNWRGIPWCSGQELLSDLRVHNGFFVPALGSEAAVTGVKELMGRGHIKEKYYSQLQTMASQDTDKLIRCLKPAFGPAAEEIAAELARGDFKQTDQRAGQLRRMLARKDFSRYLKQSWSRAADKAANAFHPKGKLVAFVGPDGSGKTTIITQVTEYLRPYFSDVKFYHMRYEIMPELKTGFGFSSMKGTLGEGADTLAEKQSAAVQSEAAKPKKQKRSLLSILASWFVVIYYTIEFVVGNGIIRKCRRRSQLVMYDRYYYDHFLQPTTRDLIYPFRKFLLGIVEKPDLVVHLNADPAVVYVRKQELKPQEIAAQNRYIARILKDVDTAVTIDTSTKGIDEISREVFETCKNKWK